MSADGRPPALAAPPDPPPLAAPEPVWVGGFCLDVDGVRVGLRADESDLLGTLRSVFGTHTVEAESVPEDYGVSVARRGGLGPRMIPAFLHGRATVLRSRSRPRVLRRLDLALAELGRDPDQRRLRLATMGAVTSDGRAVLVPQAWLDRSAVEHAVAGAGLAIAEGVALRLDVDTLDLLVEDGLLGTAGPAELADGLRPRPGRHELRAIVWGEDQVGADERRATSVARLATLVEKPEGVDRHRLLTRLAELAARCAPERVQRFSADLAPVLAALR